MCDVQVACVECHVRSTTLECNICIQSQYSEKANSKLTKCYSHLDPQTPGYKSINRTRSRQPEAIKLEKTGLCFRGPLPEKQVDECNMPKTEDTNENRLQDGEMVKALMLAPKRNLDQSALSFFDSVIAIIS